MTVHWNTTHVDSRAKESNILKIVDDIIVGKTKAARRLKHLITIVATSSAPVMILGETGTGKELVAEAVHSASGRKGAFISINCAAIPTELLESELFGYEKGAFTGADKQRLGRFEMAQGGTLFLDEIGDMPLALQSKLLRALETRKIQRVGGGKDIAVDFRLVTATHRDLEKRVEAGEFRADLYYRMNVFPVDVPSLAERTQDIPLLIEHLIKMHLTTDPHAVAPILDDSALKALAAHDWPGNVRELRNIVERAMVIFPGGVVTGANVRDNLLSMRVPDFTGFEEADCLWENTSDLGGDTQAPMFATGIPSAEDYRDWFNHRDGVDLRRMLQDIEAVMIESSLKMHKGLVTHASEALGLRRTTLVEKMKKLGIER